MNYAPPDQSPNCACRNRNPIAPTLCMTGHMTECHYPLGCREAACNHLTRYEEVSPQEMTTLETLALARLQRMADPHCEICRGSGTTKVPFTVQAPPNMRETLGDSITFTTTAVCACVAPGNM